MTLLALLAAHAPAAAIPLQYTHQGRLTDGDGAPMNEEVTITFRIVDSAEGGSVLWEDTLTTSLDNGFYSVVLGTDEDENPLDTLVFDQAPVWLELQLEASPPMYPRQPVNSVPYAQMAAVAESAIGGIVDVTEIRISGETIVSEDGTWSGDTPAVDWSDLTGIPDDFEDGVDADALLGISCESGDVLGWADGWVCATDTDTVLDSTTVRAMVTGLPIDLAADSTMDGQPLLTELLLAEELRDGDNDTLSTLACADQQIARWSAPDAAWICDDDIDIDTVLAPEAVRAHAEAVPLDLAPGTTVGGASLATGAGVPAGVIVMWSGTIEDIPDGWRLCDGTDGTPDLSDRFVMGTTSDPGFTGGASAQTLTTGNLPSHTHPVSDPGHSHRIRSHNLEGSGVGRWWLFGAEIYSDEWGVGEGTTTATTGISIGSAGSGEAFDNRPDFYALAFIIKT